MCKILNQYIVLLSALLFSSFSLSCGPMNQTPKKDKTNGSVNGSDNGSGGTTPSIGSSYATKEKRFIVYVAPIDSISAQSKQSEVGDVLYLVRCVHSGDLNITSTKSTMTIVYRMPDMPEMGTSMADGTRQPDGAFQIPVFYGMAGRWELTLNIRDGDIYDEYVFEVNI